MMSFRSEEIRLELKYGSLAGKWFGSKDKRPIIALHGWLDNAGSFDTLIPRLPTNLSYLALDLPGHGLSSHISKGCFYHYADWVAILEEIRVKYKWAKLSLMGHSVGAMVCFLYSSLYPARADLVIALDSLRVTPRLPLSLTMGQMEKLYDSNSEHDSNSQQSFSYAETKERWYVGSLKSVDIDKVDYLLKRGTKLCPNDPNKFQLSRDPIANHSYPLVIENEISFHYIKRITAAYMFIKSDDRNFAEPPHMLDEAVKVFKKNNPHFRMMHVKGTHHVHLNDPELMSQEISNFIKQFYTDSR